MQSFDSLRQLRNEKKYDAKSSINMNQSISTEINPIMNAPERNVDDDPEMHVLTL